jgi:hypothetical protein
MLRAAIFALVVAGCGQGGGGKDMTPASDMTVLINGCPPLSGLLAMPGDPIDGDTWGTYAQGFFATWCTRCHSSMNVGSARNGAPDGYNWDDLTAVQAHIDNIRSAVGVGNFMPPNDPLPPCSERRRIVRWIDAGGP